jgi:competence protein ComEA
LALYICDAKLMNKELLKDWFHYHLSARRGIFVLCLLLLFSVACRIFLPKWIKPEFSPFPAESIKLRELLAYKNQAIDSIDFQYAYTSEQPIGNELFPFDPNTLDDESWNKLGLSDGQIKSIRKYLNANGKFRVKSDLAKMYVVSGELFARWEPYIQLPTELTQNNLNTIEGTEIVSEKTFQAINLNRADSMDLLDLPGIGPYYAGAIVKYRKRLGGFLHIDQLLEIWKMKPETIELIRSRIQIDPNDVTFIFINSIGAEALSLHPYLNSTKARALISYRDKHGPFVVKEDIRNCVLIDETTFEKIAPYLKL